MYLDIGKKIKNWAKFVFILATIVIIIVGISDVVKIHNEVEDDLVILTSIFTTIGIVFLEIVIAYISTWLLYGFGELIDKVSTIEEYLSNGLKQDSCIEEDAIRHGDLLSNDPEYKPCPVCGANTATDISVCHVCNYPLQNIKSTIESTQGNGNDEFTSIIFCPVCGANIKDDKEKCHVCGIELKDI